MAIATGNRKIGEGTQTNATVVTPTPDEIKSMLLADGKWHDVQNVEKVQFAVTEAHSPTNPDGLFKGYRCDEQGRSILVPIRQVVAYSNQASQQGGQSGNGNQYIGNQR